MHACKLPTVTLAAVQNFAFAGLQADLCAATGVNAPHWWSMAGAALSDDLQSTVVTPGLERQQMHDRPGLPCEAGCLMREVASTKKHGS
jgi:hypothetical protein